MSGSAAVIAIVDYGASNLRSVLNAFEAIGHKGVVTNAREQISRADAIVLPGVGAFGDGIDKLEHLELLEPLTEQVCGRRKPYLGICLGLQYLARGSTELGAHTGFGWVQGDVTRIEPVDARFRIPHMGWNDLEMTRHCFLFEGLGEHPSFYFVHSYALRLDDAEKDALVATCSHGTSVTAAIQKDNVCGVQFHPEKSQRNGLRVLENFVKAI